RETDMICILKAGAEIKMVNTRPVDSAHAHRAGCAVDVNFAPFQHSSALRYQIRRVWRAGNHFKDSTRLLVAAHQRLWVESGRGINNRSDLRMINRASREEYAVLPTADDLAIFDDHSAERSTPALLDRLGRQPRGLFHEFAIHFFPPSTNQDATKEFPI